MIFILLSGQEQNLYLTYK